MTTQNITLAAGDWTQIASEGGLIETNGTAVVLIHFGATKPSLASQAYHTCSADKSVENTTDQVSWGRPLNISETASVVFTGLTP